MSAIKEKATDMLQRSEVVVLTSVDPDGYPRPVPMAKIKSEGLTTVWMSTGNDAVKTRDFRNNPKAGLCFYEQGNSVALTGEVEIVTDPALKQQHWQEWFIAHFPGGPTDPNYILLRFTGVHATIWIDGIFQHRTVASLLSE